MLLDMVTLPPPLNVTPELPTISSVALPVEFSVIAPALLRLVPFTVRTVPLLKLRLSSESMVRFFTCSLASRVTGEFNTLPLSMQALVVAVGTPPDHFAAVLKVPAPPFQLVSQALKPEVASKN